jgi:hypothetical protein
MLKNKNIDLNDNNINEKPVFRHKKPIIYPDIPVVIIEPEKPIIVNDTKKPIIPKRKKRVTHYKEDGTIGECEIEIPDDQPDTLPTICPEEIQNNQPIIRKDFIEILKKTFNEIDKVNARIKNLENIITEHNTLLKNIIKQISK